MSVLNGSDTKGVCGGVDHFDVRRARRMKADRIGMGATRSGGAGRRLVRAVGGAFVAAFVLVCVASAVAFAGPVWRLDSMADTSAAPGSSFAYFIAVKNVGDGASNGVIGLSVALPAGITASSVSDDGGMFTCSGVPGGSSVSCSTSAFASLSPGSTDILTLGVSVGPSASGTLTSVVSVSGGGAPSVTTGDPTSVTSVAPGFGVDAFDGAVNADATGSPFTQAGGHPYSATTQVDFNTVTNPDPFKGPGWPVEPVKDVLVDLPPGLIGNPTVAAQCTVGELANANSPLDVLELCPPASQVGTTLLRLNFIGTVKYIGPAPVFKMVPPPGVPARFGFDVAGTVVTLDAQLRSGSDYGLTINASDVSEGLPIAGVAFTFWGVPADPVHTPERACAGQHAPVDGGPTCEAGVTPRAFLRNPTACTAPGSGLATGLRVDSWAHPGDFRSATFVTHVPPGYSFPPSMWGPQQGPTGCEKVPFDPTLSAKPASPAQAGSPSGFTFDVNLPQNDDPSTIGEGDLKKVVVQLPEGVRVSPSSADGLEACTPAQIGLLGTGFPAPNPIHFTMDDPTCPEASQLGTVQITTPLLADPLKGSIYLASPNENPFGTLIAVYLVAKGPGLILKIPGQASTDPSTGQLTATFDNNPQTPFANLHLEFKGGPRAPFVTPSACGTYTTHASLTSWSGKTVPADSQFTLTSDSTGAPCHPLGFNPTLQAGGQNPAAGAASPFLLYLTRTDQDQELGALTVDMPTGLLGRISNSVLCPDAAARAGSCEEVSRVGSVTVGAGPGTNPFYITNGRAYITGPYKGAPFGLSIVIPAVAGPFNLGDVVVRAAIYVDRTTAQLKVVSDPLPRILQGIPLEVRDVRVIIDKPNFIINPTSCAVKHVAATVTSTQGAVAHPQTRFQVLDCSRLALAPKLTLSVGSPHHTGAGVSTPFSTTLTQTPGQSNLRSVSVSLPTTLNARLPVVNKACTLAEFHSGHCAKARAGTAVAITPLLRDPLRGSVYFVKNPRRALPDLMVALHGQVNLDLTGKVTIPGGTRLATTFDTIPDAPITRFTLRLFSGKNGPVGTAQNLCTTNAKNATASIGIRGQNGKLIKTHQRLHINGCSKTK